METFERVTQILLYSLFFIGACLFALVILCYRVIWEMAGFLIWICKKCNYWSTGEECPKCGNESFEWEAPSFFVNEMQGTKRWRGECYRSDCKHVETETRPL